MAQMNILPSEIILHIARFLEPLDIVSLQHVNSRFLVVGRDDTLWREQCFMESSFLENLRRRRELISTDAEHDPHFRDLALALANGNGLGESRLTKPREEARDFKARSNEKIRIMANWDPSYPSEKVRWYDEYIARNAPISTSWLQQPRNRESTQHEYLEIRGMGLYTETGESDSSLVVAPLDDGSVCVWDIAGTLGRKGSIVARSNSGMLFPPEGIHTTAPKNRSKMISPGVTECISIDNIRKRAYIAIQEDLVEVDLQTLSTVSREKFPFLITALSEAKYPVPLTVGTNLALYLHDSRARGQLGQAFGLSERLESYDTSFGSLKGASSRDFRSLLNPEPSPVYAHLSQPGPLSILHLPSSDNDWDGNGDIYVAGRFPSILNYDRRYFPRLRGTIYSGARLCAMASLPYPFTQMEKDLARRGELSTEQVYEAKTRPGQTLICAGEYNSKGSLEIYGLSPNPQQTTISSDSAAGSLQNSVLKNRQTSSSSKLLSVSNHGTRMVVSDGSGNLKWLERDGFTVARNWNVAQGSVEAPVGIFGTMGGSYMDSGTSGDIVLKLANTHRGQCESLVNENLVMWTGEKIGLLDFSSKPGFTADSFEEKVAQTPEEARTEKEERSYSQTMREALQANAHEVRFLRGLGLGRSGRR
ncbi:hypothetical protein LAWI1_G006711 [Lachnellula willkommii]|uniref:F-box domain-containing protein n=1 Tax=Lachnellula willkommii TaxID=215461 RepID=A0A559M394_9HELO|nr:hypothetical protein LAWI1_G006711 [Lachnellula willkommii]